MDITQIILVAVISILTLMLVFVGLQVFLLIKEARQTIRRANKVVDELGFATTMEVLKLAFGTAKAKQITRKASTKSKNVVEKVEEDTNGNGQIQLKAPRFFKGIPKRR